MARVFYIVCPKCDNKFYASVDDFRHQDRKLWCPVCEHTFLDKDAKQLIENK
jgi:predicted Zn finger-like uncharacterized protein